MSRSQREWAKLGVYSALAAFGGDPKKEHICAKWITFTIQRLSEEENGQLLDGVGMIDKVKSLMKPDQGADLEDMGEHSEWIIDTFVPRTTQDAYRWSDLSGQKG